jgi:hypothetical protein
MTLSRRSLITGLVSLVAAPAIVRVASIMPVKAMEPLTIEQLLALRIAVTSRVLDETITKLVWGGPPIKIHGVEIAFDVLCPADTVYLIGQQSVVQTETP